MTDVPVLGTIISVMGTRNISDLLFTKTRRAILLLLYGHPGESFHLRQILRVVNSGHGAVQRELKALSEAGIVSRKVNRHRAYYQANTDFPAFRELRTIVMPAEKNTLAASDKTIVPISKRFGISQERLAEFCQKHHIKKLALFGSVLRDDFRADSDIDVLVEFETGHVPGFGIVDIEDELSRFVGRKVDLRTPRDLSRYFRNQVVQEAEVCYAAT